MQEDGKGEGGMGMVATSGRWDRLRCWHSLVSRNGSSPRDGDGERDREDGIALDQWDIYKRRNRVDERKRNRRKSRERRRRRGRCNGGEGSVSVTGRSDGSMGRRDGKEGVKKMDD